MYNTKSVNQLLTAEEIKLITQFNGKAKRWIKEFEGFNNVATTQLEEMITATAHLIEAYKESWSNDGYFIIYQAKHSYTAVKELYRYNSLKFDEKGVKSKAKTYLKKYETTYTIWELLFDSYKR